MEVGTKIAQVQNLIDQHIETIEKLINTYEEDVKPNPDYSDDEMMLFKLWLRDNIFRIWVKVLQQSIQSMDDSNRTDILRILNEFEKPIANYINKELGL
ncbi:hypothetical protein R4Z09_30035 [Niallia oryzisoli]|uniref:Uncharacterized protein n=1 Tax=Niallia oryzisoli TaxID=1737571 RepID=A0ABZ2CC60_9BACI